MSLITNSIHDQYHQINPHLKRAERVADGLLTPLKVWHLSHQYEVVLVDGDYALSSPTKLHSKILLIASIVLLPLSLVSVVVGLVLKVVLQEISREIKQKFSYPPIGSYQDPHRISKL